MHVVTEESSGGPSKLLWTREGHLFERLTSNHTDWCLGQFVWKHANKKHAVGYLTVTWPSNPEDPFRRSKPFSRCFLEQHKLCGEHSEKKFGQFSSLLTMLTPFGSKTAFNVQMPFELVNSARTVVESGVDSSTVDLYYNKSTSVT